MNNFRSDRAFVSKALTAANIVGGPVRGKPGIILSPYGGPTLSGSDILPRYTFSSGNGLVLTKAGGMAVPPAAVASTAEGAAKTAIADLTLAENPEAVPTVAGFTKVTADALKDIAELPAFLESLLKWLVQLQIDRNIFAALPAVAGVGADLALKVAAEAQAIYTAKGVYVDTIVFSPVSIMKAMSVDPFTGDLDSLRYLGLRVGISGALAPSQYALGPFQSYSLLAVREDVNVELGMVDDDFIKNMRTVLGEARAKWSTPDTAAFGIGTIA
jgi:hypothetical protein